MSSRRRRAVTSRVPPSGADKQRSAFRFDRHFFLGLTIGVLAAVIIGLGITAIAKPDVFKGSDATESMLGESTPGGVLLQAAQVVTPDDFEAEVLKSSRPELVVVVDNGAASASLDNLVEMISWGWEGNGLKYYYATDDASLQYISGLSVRTGEEQPSLAMFYQGRLVAQQSLLMDVDSAALWVTRNNPAKPAPTPTTAPASTTTTEPVAGPAIFRAFLSSMHDYVDQDPSAEYYIGEVNLTAVDYQIDGFVNADQAITVPIDSNTALFSLVGNAFGGDASTFVLPDLSGQLPLTGLTYQLGWKGIYPDRRSDEPARSYTAGNVKYMEIPIDSVYELNDALYMGDITLARNIDGLPNLSRILIPCDGRELRVDDYMPLSALLGTRFGGNGTSTFAVPDLRGDAPIDGGTYYIVVQGIFPSHGDGIPVPTPTSTTTTTERVSAVLFRALTSAMDDKLQISAASDYYLGEVVLSAADFAIDGFVNANKPVSLPVDSNAALFALVGNSFGGDSASFGLPGLSGQLPLAGLTYQINTSGAVPPKAGKAAKSHTVGSIKYLEIPITTIRDVGDHYYLGDIILTKGLSGGFAVSRDLALCDGRALGVYSSQALESLLGSRFNNGSTLPDLTGRSPIEGAEYYIVVTGEPPPRR